MTLFALYICLALTVGKAALLLLKLYGRNADAGCCIFFGQAYVIKFQSKVTANFLHPSTSCFFLLPQLPEMRAIVYFHTKLNPKRIVQIFHSTCQASSHIH